MTTSLSVCFWERKSEEEAGLEVLPKQKRIKRFTIFVAKPRVPVIHNESVSIDLIISSHSFVSSIKFAISCEYYLGVSCLLNAVEASRRFYSYRS